MILRWGSNIYLSCFLNQGYIKKSFCQLIDEKLLGQKKLLRNIICQSDKPKLKCVGKVGWAEEVVNGE